MQLKVTHYPYHPDDLGGQQDITITSFKDIVKVGAEVARGVRAWLRQVPMIAHAQMLDVRVSAEWIEDKVQTLKMGDAVSVPAPKRKRKARK